MPYLQAVRAETMVDGLPWQEASKVDTNTVMWAKCSCPTDLQTDEVWMEADANGQVTL